MLEIDRQTVEAEQEKTLWINFINGDDLCYEILYQRYVDVLFQYGIQFIPDNDLIKDAIHDVFVKIYTNRNQLKVPANIKFHLFTCLKNHLYNLLKKEIIFDKLDNYETESFQDTGAEDTVLAFEVPEDENKLQIALKSLTDRQREVIYYRYIEELDMNQICALMDMNYQSVQNLIQRSLKKMKSIVQLILFFF